MAAEETMKAVSSVGYSTWRANGKAYLESEEGSEESLDASDTQRSRMRSAIVGWLRFRKAPQNHLRPGEERLFIIKQNKPVVVPVVISGFWRAFNKKGLKFKKKGSLLSNTFQEPLKIDYEDTVENILDTVMNAIEQSREYMMKGKHHLMNVLDK